MTDEDRTEAEGEATDSYLNSVGKAKKLLLTSVVMAFVKSPSSDAEFAYTMISTPPTKLVSIYT